MPYVYRTKHVDSPLGPEKIMDLIGDASYKCRNSKLKSYIMETDRGAISITKPFLNAGCFEGSKGSAYLHIGAEELSGIFGYFVDYIGEESEIEDERISMRFVKDVNAGKVLEDGIFRNETIDLNLIAYNGALDGDTILRKFVQREKVKVGDGSIEEREHRVSLIEPILDDSRKPKIGIFRAKTGINVSRHEKALLRAKLAKEYLGFEYSEISPSENKGFAMVCAKPLTLKRKDIPSVLAKYAEEDCFNSAELYTSGKHGYLTARINPEAGADKKYSIKINEFNMSRPFGNIVRECNCKIPENSEIIYHPWEKSETAKAIAGALTKSVDIISDAASNVVYKFDQTDSLHPIRKKKQTFEKQKNSALKCLKKMGVKENTTRGEDCLIQYSPEVCIKKVE